MSGNRKPVDGKCERVEWMVRYPFKGIAAPFAAAALVLGAFVAEAETLNVTADMTLGTNAVYDAVSVSAHAMLNLDGHTLTTGNLSGEGTILSATQDPSATIDGYTLLDFVETPANNSSENQVFIDTLYKPTCTDRVETKVFFASTSGAQIFFSSRKTSSAQTLSVLRNNNVFRFDRNNKFGHATSAAISANTPYEIVADFGNLDYTVNHGAPLATTSGTGDFEAYTNILLFTAGNLQGSVYELSNFATSCRMYYFRVYDSTGTLKVNLVPVIKNDVVGFYDTERKIFLTPANGALVAYKRVGYVQSPENNTGSIIETGYKALLTDRVETKFRPGDTSGFQGVFSARASTDTNTFSCIIESNGSTCLLRFDHHTTNPHVYHNNGSADSTFVAGLDCEIVMDGNTSFFSVNGMESAVPLTACPEDESADTGTTMRLFAVATKGSGYGNFAKKCRIYYFRVYDKDGNLKLDFVPVMKTQDGSVGFYDRVSELFHPGGAGMVSGPPPATDLTSPNGRCWSPLRDTDRNTSVTNLFNNNFINSISSMTRFIIMNVRNQKPVIDYDFGENNAQAVNMYRICGGGANRTPTAWEIWGSDTAFGSPDETGWTLLDSRSGEPGWYQSELRTKAFDNDTAYRYYRFKTVEKGSEAHFELTQIEYFHVEKSFCPGELHVYVGDGEAVTNASVRFGGNVKVVKDGDGLFASSVSNQLFTGGIDVKAGTFVVGAPLSAVLTMTDDTVLGFNFETKDAVPLLTLRDGSSFPSSLGVMIDRNGSFSLPARGVTLTSGYDFGDTEVDLLNPSSYVRSVRLDAQGNLVTLGPSGFLLFFR